MASTNSKALLTDLKIGVSGDPDFMVVGMRKESNLYKKNSSLNIKNNQLMLFFKHKPNSNSHNQKAQNLIPTYFFLENQNINNEKHAETKHFLNGF